ncbi:ATP-dependent DNA ligase [Sulfuracidifex metallicus]|uniref:DNA ligase n=1 Tax=Sulfuracidifex metallicus DSM 6482 = JCM 9184 TaxID=523847 RepID=A0A6A9QHI1_SULME|nr:ATP-dependent DNA ligase [Sulfuracidifex metallicus]MUN28697.1 ATP-dependent DNA ligase [Sulfuracidifex metallicus DSM 6482 = JCM 9184]WOE50780.1 ATP-dependent DNA ligase [Sulfuracidifex metallicus DSM 6482 = JCM 9184]
MDFKLIAEYFDKLEKISSRIQLTNLLSELLKNSDQSSIDKVIYLVQGKLGPDFAGIPELGIGEKFLVKACSIATGVPEKDIEELGKKSGDLGQVVFDLKSKGSNSNILSFLGVNAETDLSVDTVYENLFKIATQSGEKSRELKIGLLAGLLQKASPLEAKFIIRFVEGRLRVGIGDSTIIDALGQAFGISPNVIERAYNLRADLGSIGKLVILKGEEELKQIKPKVGIPIRPMLGERLQDPVEILNKLGGSAMADYKYDGERAQIHKNKDTIEIFSRRMENITSQYPDVAEMVKQNLSLDEAIVEGEIVAVDSNTGELRPFQDLMHRKRKNNIESGIKDYPVNLFLFDLMFANQEDFTNKPLLERRKLLESSVKPNSEVKIAKYIITSDVNEVKKFFLQAISDGAEGLMLKSISQSSIYQAGARGWLWIKFKKDYQSEMADTVDLVIVGGFYGKGKRGGKLSSLLLASYNPTTDTFDSVCKVASGFTDEELDNIQKKLLDIKRNSKHPRVNSKLEADVWVEPIYVVEIIGAEITLSPLHLCCFGQFQEDAGLSIRFPRFIRWRDDKSPEDATTPSEIMEMYKAQLKKVQVS